MKVQGLFLIWAAVFLTAAPAIAAHQGYYRYPAVGVESLVFTAEGDLWKVSREGGIAQRLTTHRGYETHAAISPDGETIAFTGQYEGPAEVYTIPLTGGVPTRHTFEGDRAEVVGWSTDGEILYRTRHFSTLPNWQVVRLNPATNQGTLVPLAQASDAVVGSDGTVFFTRLPFQGSATKRYRGGTAENLWKIMPGHQEATVLDKRFTGTSKEPMLVGKRLYFVSDRDGTMNLWSSNRDGGELKQHSEHSGWDIQSASYAHGNIVYQSGADLHRFDVVEQTTVPLEITLASDFDQMRERWVTDPITYLTATSISPDGDHLALTARGQVFVAPLKPGRLVEVTRSEGVRYRSARYTPDGKSLIVLSDESGEVEFWKLRADGIGRPRRITNDGNVLRFSGTPSPNGEWIAYTDKNFELWVLNIKTGESHKAATSMESAPRDLVWAPDSQWLGYVMEGNNYISSIYIYSINDKTSRVVTSNRVDSYSPVFGANGKWLYFLSDRTLRSVVRSPWGPRQPEPFLNKTTKVYHVALQKDRSLRSPFAPFDELHVRPSLKEKKEEAETKDPLRVKIDFAGLVERVLEVPIPAGNYRNLVASRKRLFWTQLNKDFESVLNLQTIELSNDSPKVESVAKDIESFELTGDGKRLLIRKEDSFYSVAANAGVEKEFAENTFELSSWAFSLQPKEEWRQLFVEAWRLERDYFYDRSMHGVEWDDLLQKYLPLVERVTDRAELSDLISQLVGELSALHTFVRGGDHRKGGDSIATGHLGAFLNLRKDLGGVLIERIYETDPDHPNERSPLALPHLGVSQGDVLEAINGISVLAVARWRGLLRNQAGKPVRLRIWSRRTKQTEEKLVVPITSREEKELRYDDWENSRRMQVEAVGGGRIGYVHLRAMGGEDYSDWARNYYPVFNRQGLIIDLRHNRGGNIDSWILEKLLRKAWFYWQGRVGNPMWSMQYAFRGHMVVLCNEFTASDGEAFVEGFRRLGLGKVIGTRTWGGEIWLNYDNWLVDKGIASAAEYGVYGPEGQWLIEGHGVEPDIVVDNLPHETFLGKDAQLSAAIEHLESLIKRDPRLVPAAPNYPDKSFKVPQ